MAGKKLQSAKQKRMIDNTIVHIVLAVLAVIWLFPIFYCHLFLYFVCILCTCSVLLLV